jgi:hypothetical protein
VDPGRYCGTIVFEACSRSKPPEDALTHVAFGILIALLTATIGVANPLITFTTPSKQDVTTGGGEISFGFTPATPQNQQSLIGSNIIISNLSSASTSASCVGCFLNFTTGTLQSIVTVGNDRTWTFSGGPRQVSQFTVTGTGPDAGILNQTVLLAGYFNSPTVTVDGVLNTLPRARFFSGSLFDVKNPTLVDHLLGAGFSAANGNAFTGTYEQDFVDNNTGFAFNRIRSDALLTGTITNDNVVPEPVTVVLFSSLTGAIFLAGFLKRRRAARNVSN